VRRRGWNESGTALGASKEESPGRESKRYKTAMTTTKDLGWQQTVSAAKNEERQDHGDGNSDDQRKQQRRNQRKNGRPGLKPAPSSWAAAQPAEIPGRLACASALRSARTYLRLAVVEATNGIERGGDGAGLDNVLGDHSFVPAPQIHSPFKNQFKK